MDKVKINEYLNQKGIKVESVFVPFSQSRNKGDKNMSLNWVVTIKKNDRVILSTDYSAGIGHCPSYVQGKKLTVDYFSLLQYECEKGKIAGSFSYALNSVVPPVNEKKRGSINPDSLDVIYSLLLDSGVLNFSSFESWADEFGYNEDSREVEKLYNECLKIALKFNQLGESTISELRELFQDY